MDKIYRDAISAEFRDCIERTILRMDNTETHRPFHAGLLSPQALISSRFERSFSTSFGQRVIEKISLHAAFSGGATQAQNQKVTYVSLTDEQLTAIEHHINLIRTGMLGRKTSWAQDLDSIRALGVNGAAMRHRVISDLWWVKDGVDHFMSIKTVKPNIDQTAEAKRDLLKLALHDANAKVYYGLYYNPYGELRDNYNWKPPMGVFDFHLDEVILIGRDYWDKLGGLGFYDELLDITEEVGQLTREKLADLNY